MKPFIDVQSTKRAILNRWFTFQSQVHALLRHNVDRLIGNCAQGNIPNSDNDTRHPRRYWEHATQFNTYRHDVKPEGLTEK